MVEYKFLGRQQQLETLEKRIRGLKQGYRQNIAVVGDELVGKTSIIHQFLSKFYDPGIILIYLEARPESLAAFTKRFIGVLLYNFLLNSGIPLKEDLNFLIGKSSRFIPRTIEKINHVLNSVEKRKKNDIFAELLGLCETINAETSKFCVVIFDEFHNLESIGVNNLYEEWSKVLLTQKNTMNIIISSMKFKTRSILSKNLSLLFGNFEMMEVEPFDIKTSEDYLSQKKLITGLKPGLKNFIVNFTGGYPFYLELIGNSLLKSPEGGLVEALEGLLFESSGILHQRFSNYLKRFLDSPSSQEYISILYSISSGHNKIKDISHIMRKPQRELNLRINSLLELDCISRSGDFLKINDRVLGFWLRFVYQQKLDSLTYDAKNQKALFRDYIQGLITDFLKQEEKPVIDRVTELFRLFGDDIVQIDTKKLRLDHFKEIKPIELSGRSLKDILIGRSNDSVWIMAIKPDMLTEDFVAEFSRECRRYRNKTQKKIIVTLRDCDCNARLRALEEKIWMWDLNNLNQIFDLFSKPRLIV